MKKTFLFTTLISFIGVFQSCSQQDESFETLLYTKNTQDIVLQERSHLLPDVRSSKIYKDKNSCSRSTGTNGEIIGNSDVLLGYSYDVGNSIIGDYTNVRFPILDLDKVKALSASNVVPKALNTTEKEISTYYGMEEYESKSSVNKKVKSGFSLNIAGIFKFGRTKTISEIFRDSIIRSNNVVYGELGLQLRKGSFSILTTSGNCIRYARECLDNMFLQNLYTSTIGSIINNYGQFVLTSYYTGGKAFALYAGLGKENVEGYYNEKGLQDDINMSFSWNTDSVSGSLNWGKTNTSFSVSKLQTRNTEVMIKTYGGGLDNQAIASTKEFTELSLDLTSWWLSLADVNTHTIIDVGDEGLFPISDFVLERNFKNRFDDTTSKNLESRTSFVTPQIEIVRAYVKTNTSGENLYEVAAVLTTRQGDKIILSQNDIESISDETLANNANNAIYDEQVTNILAQKRQYFNGIKYVKNYSTKYDPAVRNPLCIRLNNFNETAMYKYTNAKTGIVYLYNTIERTALSYYTDEIDGDWILDEYGIRDWAESLPTRSISMASLANYTIIGL